MIYVAVFLTCLACMLFIAWRFTRHIDSKLERQFQPSGSFTEVEGGSIHWYKQGSGPNLILIHGLAGSGLNFSTLTALLANDYTVYVIDRPGSGFSTRQPSISANFDVQAKMILQWMDKLNIENANLVGHSMGGAIALRLALDAPARINAVSLLCPLTTPAMEPPGPLISLYIPHVGLRSLLSNTLATPLRVTVGKRHVNHVFYPELVPNEFALQGGGAYALHSSQFFNASCDIVASTGSLYKQYKRYNEITCPVGVLFGEKDKILRPSTHTPAVTELIKNSISEVVADAGHMIPITQPNACKRFIDKVNQMAQPKAT